MKYRNKVMTIIGFLFWILAVSVPFFMNQSGASGFMLAVGWLFPAVGAAIDDWC